MNTPKTFLIRNGPTYVYVVKDERGESETYRAFSLEGYQNGARVWTEGLRKDLSAIRADYRAALARLGIS